MVYPNTGVDAFGRMRVSDPLTLFDSTMQTNASPLLYETKTTGTGAISHNANEASVTMTVAAGGDSVIRQSRQYVRYKPGKSQLVKMTAVFGATPTDDLIRRLGYFDGNNGIFLQQDSSGLHFVRRSYVTGEAVDEKVPQASWSVYSFRRLDPSKAFLMFIDMEWLGVGQVRVGFFDAGTPRVAHIFNAAQVLDSVYMATANLPVRYEISSAANETGAMDQICAAVISEGGFEVDLGYPQSRDRGTSAVSLSTTEAPVIAMRPKATFNSMVNRGTIIPESIDIFATASAFYRIYYNASVTTGASWTSQGDNSIAEYDVSATAFSATGAELIGGGYVAAGTAAKSGTAGTQISVRLPLVLDSDGANPISIVVTMATLSGTGSGYGAIRWREIY